MFQEEYLQIIVYRPPTIRMDDGIQQPATNYRRTESIINVLVQRDNLVPKNPGIVLKEEGDESFNRELPVFNGLPAL